MSSIEQSAVWSSIRSDTIETFNGQTPRPEDESPIIDVFEINPQMVMRAIEETAAALNAGKITWAWSVLRARLEKGAAAIREATVDVTTTRTKAIANAERWLENAGLHYDRADHVEADLFGDEFASGRLRDHDDPALRERLLDKWAELRPRGEQAEADHHAYMARVVADRKRTAELVDQAKRETLDHLLEQAEANT